MKHIDLELKDGEAKYYPDFIEPKLASQIFDLLLSETPWQQDDIKVFGKTYAQPRLTALYANNEKPYSYSNITMYPHKFSNTLISIKEQVEEISGNSFTTCLLNLYRHGQDSNGWHADDEKELGINPVIASVSFGAPRAFHLKHRKDPDEKRKIILENGSLLLMKGATQHFWLHQIPKTKKEVGQRINLTFRVIK